MTSRRDQEAFTPARGLSNRHAQTIWPALLRRGRPRAVTAETWTAPDGVLLDVDLLSIRAGAPGVLVMHGLEGSSRSPYVRGLLAAVEREGWNGAAVNFRSCGPTPCHDGGLYHSGDTRDVRFVIERLSSRWGTTAVGAVGFSLGGNVLLKWLGEEGEQAPVRAAVAVSVPYDLGACAAAVDGAGFFTVLYRERFLRSLRKKALGLLGRGQIDAAGVRDARSFAAFDERVTAPLFGFASARDYWQRASSAGFVAQVRRPTLLIHAEDDPIVPNASVPRAAIAANPALTLFISPRGGHVGFVGGSLLRPSYHADARALAFLRPHLAAAETARAGQG